MTAVRTPAIGSFQTRVRPDDPVVRDLGPTPALPASCVLDAVFRAVRLRGFPVDRLELRDGRFTEPHAVRDELRLVFRADEDARLTVTGDGPVAECAYRENASPAPVLDVVAARRALAGGTGVAFPEHGEFYRTTGTVAPFEGGVVAELTPSAAAASTADDFLVHPALLHAALGLGCADRALRFRGFRVWRRTSGPVLVTASAGPLADVRLYDGDGAAIAEFTGLVVQAQEAPALVPANPARRAAARRRGSRPQPLDIAIVGVAGRYPGATDLDDFWRKLDAGYEAVTEVPPDRWPVEEHPGLGRSGAFLSDVDAFDPLFFRIPPSAAALLDPQERLFLETAYAAVENAGYAPADFAAPHDRVGVFVGSTWSDYRLVGAEAARTGDPVAMASVPSFLANRVSYFFGLTGPSMTVDTACSSSLTAVHLACRAIAEGDCDAAIVGGVNLILHPDKFRLLDHLNMVSSDGRCRSFGAGGDGYVPGEGVGAFLLKPRDQAVADGDTIHAVILGTAVDHGGQAAGFTVPNPTAQARVISRAVEQAGVDPDTIGYVEGHGTGTALGDPVEVVGLRKAFAGRTSPCALGSVKSNVGHLEAAAGVVALTKVLLQFRHGRIAPSLHSERLNPEIDFDSSPFRVPQEGLPWRRDGGTPRRAGVSSFGAGGSNAHVVLEEPPLLPRQVEPGGPELVVLSARSPERLREYAERVARHLRTVDGLHDVARTLQAGRPALEHRLAFVAADAAEAAGELEHFAAGGRRVRVGQGTSGDADALAARYRAGDLDGAAALWVAGATPDWVALNGGPRRRVPVPGYPFERRRLWITAREGVAAGAADLAANTADVSRTGAADSAWPGAGLTGLDEVDPVRLEAFYPELNAYATAAASAAFAAMGGDGGVPPGVLPRFERFTNAALAAIERHGSDSPTRADLLARHPEAEPYVRLLDVCVAAYPDVLRGVRGATDVLFPDSDMDLLAGVYRDNAVYDFHSAVLARHVAGTVRALGRRARVLEVGAGTGGTSASVLAALRDLDVEYWYTDIGGSFLAHGRRTLGREHPGLVFRTLDIGRDPVAQGFTAGGFDLVVAANALHAAADVDQALANVRLLLAPGGRVALAETTTSLAVLDLTFGLLEGWHQYRDPQRRLPNSPLLSAAGWSEALHRAGFADVALPGPAGGSHELVVATRGADPVPAPRDEPDLERATLAVVAAALGADPGEVRPDRSFAEYGVDSILAVRIVKDVNAAFGVNLKPTALFDEPSVRDLAHRIAAEGGRPAPATTSARVVEAPRHQGTDIAIIGMSGRFPGAADYRELWRNVAAGVDSVDEVPAERWDVDAHFQPWPPAPGKTYSRWGGYLSDVDRFDPMFFDIVPAEADFMDPQQRLFLEESWKALEDAGIDPHGLRRAKVGVFAGAPWSDYLNLIRANGHRSHHVFAGNSPAILPARVAYHLDLTGPCVGVDTACSSSLVALWQACRSLATGESELALAGGVAVFVTPEYHQLASSLGMLSPTGRSRSFDASADGFVISEGVGVVVLKPLAAALADGDPVHGVIRGIGVNQDGRTNGITAPSARSQAELELEVYRRHGIDPAGIGYVEAHGTGTKLGDPIEVEALTRAFRDYTDARGVIPIGSVKANIGHASHAAGMAGLFKVLLAMREGTIPPSPHFAAPNPLIGFEDTPFRVPTRAEAWTGPARRAAVSSFGFSGTNAHVVVDEHVDTRPPTRTGSRRAVVTLSARTEDSLLRQAAELADFLAARTDIPVHDVAATLQLGRAAFEWRLAVVADSTARLVDQLRAGEGHRGTADPDASPTPAVRPTPDADPDRLAAEWAAGATLDFTGLYEGGAVRRVNLPGYAFARERYWLPEPAGAPAPAPVAAAAPETAAPPRPEPESPSEPPSDPETGAAVSNPPSDDLRTRAEEYLVGALAAESRLPVDRIRTRVPLQEYGIDSVLIAKLNQRLAEDFDGLPATLFFEYRTIRELAGHLASEHRDALLAATTPRPSPVEPVVATASAAVHPDGQDRSTDQDIAVIGMAGRYPMAGDNAEFWANLLAGRDCVVEVPADRWDHSRYLSDDPDEPGATYARWGGFLDDVDKFDARFFNVTPAEAESMDPQQRLFLETSWAALEDGGYTPQRIKDSARRRGTRDAGVFVGVNYAEYQLLVDQPIAPYWAVANRVSYHFGFNGPSFAADTACSASLTAIHLACQSLRTGECGYAIAGGVNLSIHPGKFLMLGAGRWASTDGKCRTFGAGGDGYVPGEGVVALVLKPLKDARADGDRVYGVIKASEINHDGHTNGFSVPNPNAQAELIHDALRRARVDARDLEYVEAHGTGTALGDPIEIAGLTKAHRRFTADRGYCVIGSAKGSVGHLEAAAGAAGLVKTLLQLEHDTIAPSPHADPPNPNIDFESSPFRVARTATPWPRRAGRPRLAAVSSFGAGGSNAHVVVGDAEPVDLPPAPAGPELVVLSARRADRLVEQARNLASFLRSARGGWVALADVAWTLAVGREAFEHRLAVVAHSTADLAERLEAFAAGRTEGLLTGTVRAHDVSGGESDADQDYLRGLHDRGEHHRVGELWTRGWLVDWAALRRRARIVSLPTYPFTRERHWIVPEEYRRPAAPAEAVTTAAPAETPAVTPVDTAAQDELMTTVQRIFADITKTPVDDLDVDADFLDFGFDSVTSVRMLNRLMKHYGVRIPADTIDDHNTIRSFSEHLVGAGLVGGSATPADAVPLTAATSAVELASVLTEPARPAVKFRRDEPFPAESVFITGVTGVLGAKLLHDLLRTTDARVSCLVRGKDVEQARERILFFLGVYDPEGALTGEFHRRVTPVLGDVAAERLGLDDETWERLAAETDVTIHNAAVTALVTFYESLAPVNVDGTRRVIDFALRTKHKYLAYVSSFAALGDYLLGDNPPYTEHDLELGQDYDHLPYQETKYHSEKLVRAASDRGLVWNIFRPGDIMGESGTGRYPFAEVSVKGAFYDFFKTFIETGTGLLTPINWDITPVDYVSAGLLHLALRRPHYGETYHLTNPDHRSLFDAQDHLRDFGYPIRFATADEFARIAAEGGFRRYGTDEPYHSQTIEMIQYAMETWGRVHYEISSRPDCSYTRRILAEAGIDCPPVAELIPVYLRHCVEVGYLAPPPERATPAGLVSAGAAR